jgi:hypothetical protein
VIGDLLVGWAWPGWHRWRSARRFRRLAMARAASAYLVSRFDPNPQGFLALHPVQPGGGLPAAVAVNQVDGPVRMHFFWKKWAFGTAGRHTSQHREHP